MMALINVQDRPRINSVCIFSFHKIFILIASIDFVASDSSVGVRARFHKPEAVGSIPDPEEIFRVGNFLNFPAQHKVSLCLPHKDAFALAKNTFTPIKGFISSL